MVVVCLLISLGEKNVRNWLKSLIFTPTFYFVLQGCICSRIVSGTSVCGVRAAWRRCRRLGVKLNSDGSGIWILEGTLPISLAETWVAKATDALTVNDFFFLLVMVGFSAHSGVLTMSIRLFLLMQAVCLWSRLPFHVTCQHNPVDLWSIYLTLWFNWLQEFQGRCLS